MHRILTGLLACASLAACTDTGSPTEPPAASAAAPAQKTVIDPQLRALERAKAVQGQLEKDKARTDEEIKQAEGG